MTAIRGIWSAVPTPIDAQYAPDTHRAVAFYRELLANGCDGINLLGTTGQAMSFDVAARRGLMHAVAESGIDGARVMCGTGAASLNDAIALTLTAHDAGFAAALVMPPFFYRDAGDEGIVRFFDALMNATTGHIILYNFPRMSGIAFHLGLVSRLLEDYPGRVIGIKDSSNDRAYQQSVIARHPSLAILPGAESYLSEALEYGIAGCISGSVALWPALAQKVFRERNVEAARELAAHREALGTASFIPTVHARIASARNDEAWRRVVPPLEVVA